MRPTHAQNKAPTSGPGPAASSGPQVEHGPHITRDPRPERGTKTERDPSDEQGTGRDDHPRSQTELDALDLIRLLSGYAGNERAISELLARILDSKDRQRAQHTITLALALTFSECITVVNTDEHTTQQHRKE